jgi:hypothetical protein
MSFFNFTVDPDCPPDKVYFVDLSKFRPKPLWTAKDGTEYFNWNDVPDIELLKARLTGHYKLWQDT